MGDIPENFPYDAAVARQRVNEARINDLEKILQRARARMLSSNKIELGTRIKLERENTQIIEVILVDEETIEQNPKQGFISNRSPLGCNLIGKKEGDIILVEAPIGVIKYKILGIE